MIPEETSVTSQVVRQQFVGRLEALELFYLRFAYRHMKNGIYYFGKGGLGKTWLLKKIALDNADLSGRVALDIIDFFDSKNHSVRGLQSTIKQRLAESEVFESYDVALLELDEARAKEDTHLNVIASLESRANRRFIECCQKAVTGREIIFLFDTFERVQRQYVSRWLLHDFLTEVRGIIFAIAGRPDPKPADMPDNVEVYELKGMELVDVEAYLYQWRHEIPKEDVKNIWKHTQGEPLTIQLILDLPQPQRDAFIAKLAHLQDGELVQNQKELRGELVEQFTFPSRINRVIWAMAYFKRRFDTRMLRYIVENGEWFRPGEYDDIFQELRRSNYVQEYPELESHLLHDEIQRIVSIDVLHQVDPDGALLGPLYELIVNQYYPYLIEQAAAEQKSQLMSEKYGYLLDKDSTKGLEAYKRYRAEINVSHDYAFEELLWSELRDAIGAFGDKAYDICFNRGDWLLKNNLFPKAEDHYRYMMYTFDDHPAQIREYLGFVIMRQGRLEEAREILTEGLEHTTPTDHTQIAAIQKTLGQLERVAGNWDNASEHYKLGFRAAIRAGNRKEMASVYINRGFLYSLRGEYDYAKQQCQEALKLIDHESTDQADIQRGIYARMNLGSAHRHSDDYKQAAKYFMESLTLAQANNNRQAIGDVLQQMGINAHLWGRSIRREIWGGLRQSPMPDGITPEQEQLNRACEFQWEAWQHLTQALDIAVEAEWRDALADGYNRLAKVYREVERLKELIARSEGALETPQRLLELQKEGKEFRPAFEIEYEDRLRESHRPFEELDGLEKVARLFDLSAWLADETSDFDRELSSLSEFSHILVELRRLDDVESVLRRIEWIRGSDFHEKIFAAMNEITRGDLALARGDQEAALERYKTGYLVLAEGTGYAQYLLRDRLRDLEISINDLPAPVAARWCGELQEAWDKEDFLMRRPTMLHFLEAVSSRTLDRCVGQECDLF